jgi:hypothetical protein
MGMGLFAFVCLTYGGFEALGGLTCDFAECFGEIIFWGFGLLGLRGRGGVGRRMFLRFAQDGLFVDHPSRFLVVLPMSQRRDMGHPALWWSARE